MSKGWPKGPFPEKWTFARVETRLRDAWRSPDRSAAWDALLASGATLLPPTDDAFVRVFTGGTTEARGHLRASALTVGYASPGAKIIPGAHLALPTVDVFDALVVAGLAGPHHGVGNRTIVRFLLQARPMASFSPTILGEDLLVLEMKANDAASAELLAARLPHIAPRIDTEDLAARLLRGATLTLDWSPPR